MLAAAVPLLALFATSVLAQGAIPGLPSCAQGCITNYGGCNQVDVKCICSNKPLLETLSCCVSKNCDAAGTADVISFANSLCGSYGVTTLPTAATCASTAATPTATASSATKTATGTMTMTTAAPSGTATSMASMASTQTGTTTAAGTTATAPAKTALAVKNYQAEGLGIGMAVLGFLAAL